MAIQAYRIHQQCLKQKFPPELPSKTILLVLTFFLLAATCNRDDLNIVVETASVTDITATTATSGGYVYSDNNEEVIARGVVWDKTSGATIDSNTGSTLDGAGLGTFVSHLTGLEPDTKYYVRAYVTNARTTVYSLQTMVFKTIATGN